MARMVSPVWGVGFPRLMTSVATTSTDRAQAQFDSGFVPWREEERIERAHGRTQERLASEPSDLRLGVRKIEMEQRRGRIDARVHAWPAERRESEHPLVKLHVARIHLD